MNKISLPPTLSLLLISLFKSSWQTPLHSKTVNSYKDDTYTPLVKKLTTESQNYDGLNNQYSYQATLINQELMQAQLKLNSLYKKWSPEKLKAETQKKKSMSSKETHVFLSFYSPKTELNSLDSTNSPWELYLSHNDKRYTGKVSKVTTNSQDIQALYPFVNKWSDSYLVTFPRSRQQCLKRKGRVDHHRKCWQ